MMRKTEKNRLPVLALFLTLIFLSIIMLILHWNIGRVTPAIGGAFSGDHIVIIDPGHGGMDGGATGISGTFEKDCTLKISKKLDSLMAFLGISTVMTRTEDISLDYQSGASIRQNKVSDLHARLKLANDTENALLVSVHLNKFTQSQYRGAQVFYAPQNPNSESLGKIMQQSLISALADGNTRTHKEAPSSIYLMKNATCPAVTVECGFMSNPEEDALLIDDGYQKKLAVAIAGGYIGYLNQTS